MKSLSCLLPLTELMKRIGRLKVHSDNSAVGVFSRKCFLIDKKKKVLMRNRIEIPKDPEKFLERLRRRSEIRCVEMKARNKPKSYIFDLLF